MSHGQHTADFNLCAKHFCNHGLKTSPFIMGVFKVLHSQEEKSMLDSQKFCNNYGK